MVLKISPLKAKFTLDVGDSPFRKIINELRGKESLKEWDAFTDAIRPISKIINKLPLLTTSPENLDLINIFKLTTKLLPDLRYISKIKNGFGYIADELIKDPFLRNWVELLSFLISVMPMHDTNTAAMATLFGEWFTENATLDIQKVEVKPL